MKTQYFRDSYGNTASITAEGTLFRLVCRNYYGKKWKHSYHVSANAAKRALQRTGDSWKTTRGYVSDDPFDTRR